MQRKKILPICLSVSLFLHVMALVFFERYSLWFSSSQTAQSAENWLSLVDKKERDQILKSSFDSMSEEKEKSVPLKPISEEELTLSIKPSFEHEPIEEQNSVFFQLSFPMQEPLIAHSNLPTFSIPSQSFNLLDHLPKDLYIPAMIKETQSHFLPIPAKTSLTLAAKPLSFEETPSNSILYHDELDLSLTEESQGRKIPSPIPIPNLPKLPTLAELETSSYSDSFDADLVFLPKEEGKGYVFALTLIPRPDLNLPKLTQHITFLIDRSNSIQQARLNSTKAAVSKALESLNENDTFNIIAFDSKIEKMSPNYLPCLKRSCLLAEDFISKIQLGSFFSSSDLSKPLFLTVPGKIGHDEIHTAILLTDGETLGKRGAQRSILSDWTAYNAGKVALFAIGMHDHHLATLDAVTAINRGKLLNAPNGRGMKRKLLKLLKQIQNPIAKNLSCHAIGRNPASKITLLPKSTQMPHLYLDQPYVILGETDTLDDFILFVQAKLKDRWLNIKKTVSFLNAKKGNKSLKMEWAQQVAYGLYEEFLIDENPEHIVNAKNLLQPYDLQVALQ